MNPVEITFEFPNLKAKVEAARDEIHLSLAAGMQANRGMLFDTEGSYNGHEGWAPLLLRKGQILSDRGTLRKSMAPRPAKGQAGPDGIVELGADLVTIGTNLKYAAMMNWGTVGLPGGVLKPTKAQALRIPIPGGENATDQAHAIRQKQAVRDASARIGLLMAKRNKTKSKKAAARYDEQISALQKQVAKGSAPGGSGGKRFMFLKSVKIPGRPYDQLNELDRAEFQAILTNKVQEVLAR